MNDKRYFDIILKTEIAQLVEILDMYELFKQKDHEQEFSQALKDKIKEKVAARSQQ